jgi:hypothetical protein
LEKLERIMKTFTVTPDTTGDDSWPTERRDRWVGIEFGRLVERLKVDVDARKIA